MIIYISKVHFKISVFMLITNLSDKFPLLCSYAAKCQVQLIIYLATYLIVLRLMIRVVDICSPIVN